MKFTPIAAICFMLIASTACTSYRDFNTSTARAAYSVPGTNSYKKKNKKKSVKSRTIRKSKKNDTDAARQRRKGIGM